MIDDLVIDLDIEAVDHRIIIGALNQLNGALNQLNGALNQLNDALNQLNDALNQLNDGPSMAQWPNVDPMNQ